MSPYTKELKPISDISHYFRKNNDGSMTFTGQSLELRIPSRFQAYDAMLIGDSVTTPGVMDMIIDDEYRTGLNLLATITIVPSDLTRMSYDSIEYVVLHLKQNDTFMTSYNVVKDAHIVYVLWSEFVTSGKVPYFFHYVDMLRLFEHARELTGSGIGVSRSVFEGIIAHLSRSNKNVTVPYRLTDMKEPVNFIALDSISEAVFGTIAKLNGSYMRNEGMTSALRYQVDEVQPFENILRGLPMSKKEESSTSNAIN